MGAPAAARSSPSGNYSEWIQAHADELDSLQGLGVYVGEYPEWIDQAEFAVCRSNDLAGSGGLHNWELDACASQTLGQLAPSAFVMWDNKIKVYVAGDYRTFLFEMHALATRLIDESPVDCGRRRAVPPRTPGLQSAKDVGQVPRRVQLACRRRPRVPATRLRTGLTASVGGDAPRNVRLSRRGPSVLVRPCC